MAIEWQQRPREIGLLVDWVAVADAPDGTEIVADCGPVFGDRTVYFVAWRRKMTAGEAVTAQLTVQIAVEGYAATAEAAKETCGRLMQTLQQIARDAPSMLWKLHQVAIPPSTKTVEERIGKALNTEVMNGSGTQAKSR